MRKVVILLAVLAAGRAAAAEVSRGMLEPSPQLRILANAGVSQYAKDLDSSAGPTYGAILGLKILPILGIEGQYQGSVNDVSTVLYDRVIVNNALGDVRLGAPVGTAVEVEPFVFGGAGWMHITQRVRAGGGDITDNTAVYPVGAGLETRLGDRFLLGARFTYDFVNKDVAGKNADLWSVTAGLGGAIY